MKRLDELIRGLDLFDREIFDTVRDSIRENENRILDYNRIAQLYELGINRNGVEISSYAPYKDLTIALKSLKGQITTHVTLKDEGGFYSSFFIEYLSGACMIRFRDKKSADLVLKYGEEIAGLTDENFIKVRDKIVRTKIMQKLKRI